MGKRTLDGTWSSNSKLLAESVTYPKGQVKTDKEDKG